MNHMVNSKKAYNSTIIELFSNEVKQSPLPELTSKHLSDMLNTPLQKEREIRTNIALNVLSDMESKEACPEWIGRFIADYTKDSYYARRSWRLRSGSRNSAKNIIEDASSFSARIFCR